MSRPSTKSRHASYSNAANDASPSRDSWRADEARTKAMYEYSPYPDLGADLKTQDLYLRHLSEDFKKKDNVYVDVGCGTGHYIVGTAKRYPNWRCIGIDLSEQALNIARQLAEKHGVKNVEFHQGSYLDPLPFKDKADIISAMGTIHHCGDPEKAMQIMHDLLKDDGYMLWHMYGWRADQGKFDLKMALDILEPDLGSHEKRFFYYRTLMDHRNKKILKRIANTSLYDLYSMIKIGLRNWKRRHKKVSWSPPWNDDFKDLNSPWIDHFCHPCERAYEVPEIHSLVESGHFSVYKMIAQGKEFPQLIPHEWQVRYAQLGFWEKARLSELLAVGGGSFAMILRKQKQD